MPERASEVIVAMLTGVLVTASASAQSTNDPIPTAAPVASWHLELEDVVRIPDSFGQAPRLEQLVWNETTGLAYVIDQGGWIYAFDPSATTPSPTIFLSLYTTPGQLYSTFESGVRSMAFHPDFGVPGAPGHRKLYVTFSRTAGAPAVGAPVEFTAPGGTDHRQVVAEWTLLPSGTPDPASYRELLRIAQPFANHDAGHLGFDPSLAPGDPDYGLLYIAVGDGGSAGGPNDLSRDVDLTPAPYPHGKILRIDPVGGGAGPYAIPASNPFAGQPDRLEESYAWGFRNPHKLNWDRETGLLYVSDIGQGVVEEISIVRAGQDHGWNLREGAFEYVNTGLVAPLPLDHPSDAFSYPVAQYDHSGQNGIDGRAAIVGGPIYRGSRIPALRGTMIFADFATSPGPIFAVHVGLLAERDDLTDLPSLDDGRLAPFEEVRILDGGVAKTFRDFLRDAGLSGLARTDQRWGEGPDGDLFLLNKQDGWVRRVVAAPGHPGPPQAVPLASPWARGVLGVCALLAGNGSVRVLSRRGLRSARSSGIRVGSARPACARLSSFESESSKLQRRATIRAGRSSRQGHGLELAPR